MWYNIALVAMFVMGLYVGIFIGVAWERRSNTKVGTPSASHNQQGASLRCHSCNGVILDTEVRHCHQCYIDQGNDAHL